jgi:glycosyltransferase involved in cell wall biosynthesis
MLNRKTVAVIVAAYNEEDQIKSVLETMPEFVDRIVVINDYSRDRTQEIVKKFMQSENRDITALKNKKVNSKGKYNHANLIVENIIKSEENLYTPFEIVNSPKSRVVLINHLKNGGKGEGIKTGYRWCRDNSIECTATMDGDGQMDPDELEAICGPVINKDVDYVKANRLRHRSALFIIPKLRYFGNSILSLFTKIASGYWRVTDTQTGFTAISLRGLKAIRIHQIYSSYGYPNDILVKLNTAFCTLAEVDSKPVYNIGEKSKMNELKVVPKISWLLFKSFWKRLYQKYLFRDFHPLFLLYHFAFILFIINIPISIKIIHTLLLHKSLTIQNLMAFVLLSLSGFQSLFFAMWMDMTDNDRLQK